MENKSNSKTIITVLITLLICVIGFCIYLIVNDSNKVNNDNNGEVNNKTENNSKIENEVELTDETVKADVLDKMNAILGFNCFDVSKFSIDNNFVNRNWQEICSQTITLHVFNSELSENEKIEISLRNAMQELVGIYSEYNNTINTKIDSNLNNELIKHFSGMIQYGERDFEKEIYKISEDSLKKTYLRLFNTDLTDALIQNYISEKYNEYTQYGSTFDIKRFMVNNGRKSVLYFYDENDKSLYKVSGISGGVGTIVYKFFINNISTYDNDVYVYINPAILSIDSNNSYRPIISRIMEEYNENNFQPLVTCERNNCDYGEYSSAGELVENYKIDESNYKEFTNYRFVFKKNSKGNYYFDKVEKAK